MTQSNYNNYGEDFLEPFDKPVTFKLLGIKPDPNNKGAFLMPMFKNVPATSRVKYNGKIIDIALIRNVYPNGDIEFDSNLLQFGQFNNGEIHLTPDKPRDQKIFEYLNHCHFNRDSKYTYEGANHIIYKVNLEKEAEGKISGRKTLFNAVALASNLSDESRIKTVYSVVGNGNPAKMSINEMKNEIEEISMRDPQLIIDTIGSGDDEVRTTSELIKEAVATKAITKQGPQLRFVRNDGEVFLTYQKLANSGGKSAEDQLEEALNESEELREALEILVSAAK